MLKTETTEILAHRFSFLKGDLLRSVTHLPQKDQKEIETALDALREEVSKLIVQSGDVDFEKIASKASDLVLSMAKTYEGRRDSLRSVKDALHDGTQSLGLDTQRYAEKTDQRLEAILVKWAKRLVLFQNRFKDSELPVEKVIREFQWDRRETRIIDGTPYIACDIFTLTAIEGATEADHRTLEFSEEYRKNVWLNLGVSQGVAMKKDQFNRSLSFRKTSTPGVFIGKHLDGIHAEHPFLLVDALSVEEILRNENIRETGKAQAENVIKSYS